MCAVSRPLSDTAGVRKKYDRNYGGIGVGYSAGYKWQTVFNTFGALAIAASLFGLPMALLLRSGINVIASLYTVVCNVIYDKLHGKNTEIAENLVKP